MGEHKPTHGEKKFRTQIGVSATVERSSVKEQDAETANRALEAVAAEFCAKHPHLAHYRYLGSAAVHVFYNDTLTQLDLISQAHGMAAHRCPEDVAAHACNDLMREMKAVYGKRQGTKRSGF